MPAGLHPLLAQLCALIIVVPVSYAINAFLVFPSQRPMKTISVITPCYNEELNVRDCYEAMRQIFDEELAGYQREHIFCDNASDDRTVEILREIAAQRSGVKVIVNARNFGPLRNTFNGVMAATGDAVLLFMPADLQDPPELLPRFRQALGGRATRSSTASAQSARKAG